MGSCVTKDNIVDYEPAPLIVKRAVNDQLCINGQTNAQFRYTYEAPLPSYFDAKQKWATQSKTSDEMKAKRRRVRAEELADRFFPN